MPNKRLAALISLYLLSAATLLFSPPAHAQSENGEETAPMAAERFSARVAEIENRIAKYSAEIDSLDSRMESADGLIKSIFETRLDETQIELFRASLELAREVMEAQEKGIDVAGYKEKLVATLTTLPPAAFSAAQNIQNRISLSHETETPGDAIMADQQLALDIRDIDLIYAALIDYLEVAGQLRIDTAATRDRLVSMLEDSAANRSVYLEIANLEAAKLRSAVATLANDEALKSRLSAMEARTAVASDALDSIVELMNQLDLDTVRYRQQLLASTGQVSTDVLDVGFLANLVTEWTATATELAASRGPTLIFSVILACILLLAFMQLGKLAQKIVRRTLASERVHVSNLLERMILSTVRNLIIIIGVLVALSQLGISLGPLLAGLGIAGFIIGFALQDSLSNFASGMMILFYRPFDVGDFVEVAGVKGKVNAMSMVNTTFLTIDNQKLVVPNNMIWQSVIANYTDQSTRRVDLVVGISYGDDIDKAEAVVHEVLASYDAVLEDPAPVVKVGELGDSSVNLIVRPWVATEDYWDTYWDLTKLIKQAFDREGITIPFPQRDLHVIKDAD